MKMPELGLFDKRYDKYKTEINLRNYNQLRTFVVVGMMISLFNMAAEFILYKYAPFPFMPLIVFAYFLALHFVLRPVKVEGKTSVAAIFYLMETPLMASAILMGTFWDPTRESVTIMVFMCALPLFILDKPWRICTYITVSGAVYLACCAAAKAPEVFCIDLIDLITFWLIAIGVNIFTLRERIESVESLATYRIRAERDVLTGIYNRGSGDEKIKRLLEGRIPGAYVIMDIDNFKSINDTYGHEAGDEALIRLTETLARNFRTTDVIMRMGGDEFSVYAVGMTDISRCRKKLADVRDDIAAIGLTNTPAGLMTVSMGCVMVHGGEYEYQSIYKQADACLYRAKASGKNMFEVEEVTTAKPAGGEAEA